MSERSHGICGKCGATVYPEHIDSGIARYEEGQLMCSHCVEEYEQAHDRSGMDSSYALTPIEMEGDDEPGEAAKETRRMQNDWRSRDRDYPSRFRPYGDPGPGRLARVVKCGVKSRKCTYVWMRDRKN